MTPPNQTLTFLDSVEKSGLLSVERARGYREAAGRATAGDLARRMVGDRVLTPFQANMLLKGKYRGFFLTEKYKILDFLGSGGMGQVPRRERVRRPRPERWIRPSLSPPPDRPRSTP